MASGNWAIVFARVPAELKDLVSCYQSDRRLQSFQAALVELLETHPQLVTRVELLYDGLNQTATGEASPT